MTNRKAAGAESDLLLFSTRQNEGQLLCFSKCLKHLDQAVCSQLK